MATILIADDDRAARHILRAMLESAGHVVSEAANGVEASKIYRETNPDVLVTDMFMPDKDGLEILKELREDFPGFRAVAVSAGSAYSQFEVLRWAKAYGVRHAFSKPLDKDALLAAIADLTKNGSEK